MPPSKAIVKKDEKPEVKVLEVSDQAPQEPEIKSEDIQLSPEDIIAFKGWIPMTHDEHLVAQEQGVLAGYDPTKGLGLVNKETKTQ